MDIQPMFEDGIKDGKPWLEDKDVYNVEVGGMDLDSEDELKKQWKEKKIPITRREDMCAKKEASRLFMSGKTIKQVKAHFESKIFASKDTTQNVEKYIKAHGGLVGTVLFDCHNIKNVEDMCELTRKSEYKDFAKFAINCTCGTHKDEIVANFDKSNIDSVFSDEQTIKSSCFCEKLGLPVMKNASDFTMEAAVDVVRNLYKAGQIDKENAKNILVSSTKPMSIVKKAFETMQNKTEKRIEAKVEDKDFYIKQAATNFKIDAAPKANTSVNFDKNDKNMNLEIKKLAKKEEVSVDVNEGRINATVNKKVTVNANVDFDKKNKNMDIDMKKLAKKEVMDVDMRVAKINQSIDGNRKSCEVDATGLRENRLSADSTKLAKDIKVSIQKKDNIDIKYAQKAKKDLVVDSKQASLEVKCDKKIKTELPKIAKADSSMNFEVKKIKAVDMEIKASDLFADVEKAPEEIEFESGTYIDKDWFDDETELPIVIDGVKKEIEIDGEGSFDF